MNTTTANQEMEISIVGSAYRVIDAKNRVHYVSKEKVCSCGSRECPAIKAVAVYLKGGGRRSPEFPAACPICGAAIFRDPVWDNRSTHRPGWRCEKGGLVHFLEFNTRRISQRLAEDPWLFRPVFQEGTCVYPGIRRNEIFSWEECAQLLSEEYLETGYDPRQ